MERREESEDGSSKVAGNCRMTEPLGWLVVVVLTTDKTLWQLPKRGVCVYAIKREREFSPESEWLSLVVWKSLAR